MAARSHKTLHPALTEPGVSLYLQIAAVLRGRIEDRTWNVGDRISTIEELERELGVGRVTIRQAIELLYEEGLLRSHQGKGTFVTRAVERNRWLELSTDWQGLLAPIEGNIPHILEIGTDGSPDLTPSDGNPAEGYVCLRSVQTRNGEPFALARVHIARSLYERSAADFQKRIALVVLAGMKDANVANASQTLQVGTADLEAAQHLRVPLNAPTLEARCIVTDGKGTAVYIGEITYRGDCVRINIELKGGKRALRMA
jgi:GntR family transcriptional regulator